MLNTPNKQTVNSRKSCNGVEKETDAQKDLNQAITQEVNKVISKALNQGKDKIKSNILDKYKDTLVGKRIIIKVEIVPDSASQTELSNVSSNEKSVNDCSPNLASISASFCDPASPFLCIDRTGQVTECTECCPNGL